MKTGLIMAVLWVGVSGLMADPFTNLSFDAALKEAGKEHKVVLVDFYATWCEPCKLMDKDTWSDSGVTKLVQEKAVSVHVDVEKEADLARRYNIEAIPNILLLKPDGTQIDHLTGYLNPQQFTAALNEALKGKTQSGSK
jgi:thiol:disulfide interchange protein